MFLLQHYSRLQSNHPILKYILGWVVPNTDLKRDIFNATDWCKQQGQHSISLLVFLLLP